MSDELHAQARGDDAAEVYAAITKLEGIKTAETIELLIDLMASELEVHEGWLSDAFGTPPTRRISSIATGMIKAIGGTAIDALSARIVNPAKPGDEKLLERSVEIGKPLFELATILVTDGDAKRSRAAEPIVAKFAHQLGIADAVNIYLAICDRERYAARAMPGILRKIWPRLGTPEGRAVIAERWTGRGLWAWIDDRIDREPMAACTLLALMIAGPPEAEPVIRELLEPLQDEARWIAIESMLVVDPVRMGEVFTASQTLHAWAARRAIKLLGFPTRELELRLVIACASSEPAVVDALIRSRSFTVQRFFKVVGQVRPARLRDMLASRQATATPVHGAQIARVLIAIDGGAVTGDADD